MTRLTLDSRERTTGIVVETHKDDLRILWTYVPEMPEEDVRAAAPWLCVIAWIYDGALNMGMPTADDNRHMLQLDKVPGQMEERNICFEAYRRIGAGLREFVFYTADCDEFLRVFNEVAINHPRYPIEIRFFKDHNWSEFRQLIDDLGC